MKLRIVFIPTHWYLSKPVFFSLARECKDKHHTIYFDTNDRVFSKYKGKNIKEGALKYFDEYIEIDASPFVEKYKEIEGSSALSKRRRTIRKMCCFIAQKPRLEKQLAEIAPDVMITTGDASGYINKYCNIWAEKNEIPYIVIQPSFIRMEKVKNPWKERIGYLLFNILLRMPFCRKQTVFGNERPGNHLFVWGDFYKNFYKGLQIEKNTFVTGNPAFDQILKMAANTERPKDLGIQIPEGKKVVMICTQPMEPLLSERACGLVNDFYRCAIEENQDLFFIVKIHPRENIEKYNTILEGIDTNNYVITKDVNLYDVFKATDLQISVSSYSSFEAVVFGIPIVIINPENLVTLPDQFNNEIEMKATTKDELKKNLLKGLTNEYIEEFKVKREQYLKPRLGYLDGNSGRRIIEKIEEIIGNRK